MTSHAQVPWPAAARPSAAVACEQLEDRLTPSDATATTPGQGHQPGPATGRTSTGCTDLNGSLVVSGYDGGSGVPGASSCGRATAPPPGPPSWSDVGGAGALHRDRERPRTSRPTDANGPNSSCGRATAPPPAPSWHRPGRHTVEPDRPDERQRHAVLHGRRRRARLRAVEERRHRRRHRPGQGHQPGRRRLVPRQPDERQRHAVLHGRRRRRTATSCGRATAPPPAPCWSRTSTRAAAAQPPT